MAPITTQVRNGSFLGRLFRGEIPLVKTFWLYYILGSVLLLVLGEGLASLFHGSSLGVMSYLVLGIVQMLWTIVCLFGVWRAAGRYPGSRVWSVLARIYVVLNVAGAIYLCVQMASAISA